MALIDTDESARRLARAIVKDIRLYNAEQIAAGADISAAVAEGGELYRSRTDAQLHSIYDDAVAELRGGVAVQSAPVVVTSEGRSWPMAVISEARSSAAFRPAVLVLLAVIVTALGFWIYLRPRV